MPTTWKRCVEIFCFSSLGALELRADGSFHEWTLENQSPGGSVKLGPGALDKAVLGVRVSSSLGTKAALLRTHPPHGYPGVKGLSYSGSFPVSRLSVRDERFFGVEMDLFAYGTLRARKTDLSFVPGVTFTLSVKNPTEKEVTLSFLLNIPLGEQPGKVITQVDCCSSNQASCQIRSRVLYLARKARGNFRKHRLREGKLTSLLLILPGSRSLLLAAPQLKQIPPATRSTRFQ